LLEAAPCCAVPILAFLPIRRPPRSPLLPYTTLFRSQLLGLLAQLDELLRPHPPRHGVVPRAGPQVLGDGEQVAAHHHPVPAAQRSEEHTSELQSRENLVCRLRLEKKKMNTSTGKRLR